MTLMSFFPSPNSEDDMLIGDKMTKRQEYSRKISPQIGYSQLTNVKILSCSGTVKNSRAMKRDVNYNQY